MSWRPLNAYIVFGEFPGAKGAGDCLILGNDVICELGDLPRGAQGTVFIVARALDDVDDAVVTNTVVINSETPDPNEANNTATADVTLVACALPAAPTNVLATNGGIHIQSVMVTWDEVANADEYEIYRNTLQDFATAQRIATTIETEYVDYKPAPAYVASPGCAMPDPTVFYYWVVAVNDCGPSDPSEPDEGYENSLKSAGSLPTPGGLIELALLAAALLVAKAALGSRRASPRLLIDEQNNADTDPPWAYALGGSHSHMREGRMMHSLLHMAAWCGFLGAADVVPWDMAPLERPPKVYPAPDMAAEGVRGLYYDGLPWRGEPTRVFAWFGLPERAPGEKVPAMVLAHGGGGTAFDEWVRIWNRRGYAAIAMDLEGTLPIGEHPNRTRHEWAGPKRLDAFDDIDDSPEDQWFYHAVADIALAHSLLRSMPEIDPDRIGLTGISWGGILACTVAGVDHRFRCTIPVYGCGYLDEAPVFQSRWEALGPERSQRWNTLWDPASPSRARNGPDAMGKRRK